MLNCLACSFAALAAQSFYNGQIVVSLEWTLAAVVVALVAWWRYWDRA